MLESGRADNRVGGDKWKASLKGRCGAPERYMVIKFYSPLTQLTSCLSYGILAGQEC